MPEQQQPPRSDVDIAKKTSEHHAEEIMGTNVLVVEKGTPVKVAVQLMAKKGLGCLVVVKDEAALGIVTERDVLNKITAEDIDPTHVLIEDIMTSPIISVKTDSSIKEVAEKMSTHQVRRAVVIDKKGDLAGLITSEDLARWIARVNETASNHLHNSIGKINGRGPYA